MRLSRLFALFFLLFSFLAHPLQAQEGTKELTFPGGEVPLNVPTTQDGTPTLHPDQAGGGNYPELTTQGIILIFLALLPFMVMLLTSFLKMVIALALLRNALGVQQSPPNQAINGIALILTIYVMYPTGLLMYEESKHILEAPLPKKLISSNSAAVAFAMLDASKEPLRDFLIRNSHKKVIQGFYKLAEKTFPESVSVTLKERDFIVVTPAFIMTQIKVAFQIGVLIYLPFFVIDLVTANILLAMQMMMLSPLSISLPLKLLLVVMIDGWTVLVQGLVLSFK